jgi:hypothetical protein
MLMTDEKFSVWIGGSMRDRSMAFLIQVALSAANKAGKRALHFIMDISLSCKVEAIRF